MMPLPHVGVMAAIGSMAASSAIDILLICILDLRDSNHLSEQLNAAVHVIVIAIIAITVVANNQIAYYIISVAIIVGTVIEQQVKSTFRNVEGATAARVIRSIASITIVGTKRRYQSECIIVNTVAVKVRCGIHPV